MGQQATVRHGPQWKGHYFLW